ncbi:DnaJ-domain-containing protein [Pluteus cervinus]|uniref:DnaJ-domain-containing protein n=1 Tax=Pluteus cervinus TaxID=181527 RepID=A0ACD3AWZ8_9AGAR|nr:DnaJ-domain-containing protein [Pluteus cervinus]
MGAQESKGSSGGSGQDEHIIDYYELLEVSEDATQEEIKKSFRRLALIHHPDKNQDNVEEANKKFTALQQAYEVLSDEQERAWYDSHKASLVPEPDAQTVFEDIKKGAPPSRARDRGLTVKHLARFFDSSIWSAYDNSDDGFFTIYGNLFVRLQAEENMFEGVQLPPFGDSTWTWIPASKDENGARSFYNAWLNFATAKDFSWSDQWNLSEAPDRRVRRLMEKDNKKARDDARKEYNDTIRSLVQFIRKRDPRYKAHLVNANQPRANPTPSANPESAHKRQQLAEQYVEQDWQKTSEKQLHADLEWAIAEGGGSEEWECVVCDKTFRSEAAWNSHERSKKHIKEVERLRLQMLREGEMLGLGEDIEPQDLSPSPAGISAGPSTPGETADDLDEDEDGGVVFKTKQRKRNKKAARKAQVDELDDPEDPGMLTNEPSEQTGDLVLADEAAGTPVTGMSKKEKRRAREAKKAEASEGSTSSQLRCNVCEEVFDSRTKLFAHVKGKNHAQAEVENEGRPAGKRGKRTNR